MRLQVKVDLKIDLAKILYGIVALISILS